MLSPSLLLVTGSTNQSGGRPANVLHRKLRAHARGLLAFGQQGLGSVSAQKSEDESILNSSHLEGDVSMLGHDQLNHNEHFFQSVMQNHNEMTRDAVEETLHKENITGDDFIKFERNVNASYNKMLAATKKTKFQATAAFINIGKEVNSSQATTAVHSARTGSGIPCLGKEDTVHDINLAVKGNSVDTKTHCGSSHLLKKPSDKQQDDTVQCNMKQGVALESMEHEGRVKNNTITNDSGETNEDLAAELEGMLADM